MGRAIETLRGSDDDDDDDREDDKKQWQQSRYRQWTRYGLALVGFLILSTCWLVAMMPQEEEEEDTKKLDEADILYIQQLSSRVFDEEAHSPWHWYEETVVSVAAPSPPPPPPTQQEESEIISVDMTNVNIRQPDDKEHRYSWPEPLLQPSRPPIVCDCYTPHPSCTYLGYIMRRLGTYFHHALLDLLRTMQALVCLIPPIHGEWRVSSDCIPTLFTAPARLVGVQVLMLSDMVRELMGEEPLLVDPPQPGELQCCVYPS